jgi:D-serine deaminase-like pyridoxal phosphate-dependent protein
LNINQCDTPELILDLPAAERNIKKMADYFFGKSASLRPHIKVHKSPSLAKKQIEAGAKGITCAKVSEAEVMANSGIDDILIANEIVGEDKLRRLAKLGRVHKITVAADNYDNVKELSRIASEENSNVRVLVDVNLSSALDGILDRCGVPPGPPAVRLANQISKLGNVEFGGVMGYEGALRKFPDFSSKESAAKQALGLLIRTKSEIEESGIHVEVVSCGGTTSYKISGEFPGVTEVQAGSYIFMDAGFKKAGIDFEIALTLLTRVISKPRPDKVIIDAGYKAISAEHGLPIVKGRSNMEVTSLNAEHGHILIKNTGENRGERTPTIGDRLELIPSHVDTTTCLHDKYFVMRSGEIDSTLDIAARGKLQ